MTYDEIIEQLEITKSKIKEIARNEYGGESWNDDLDALTEAADIVADYSKATAQAWNSCYGNRICSFCDYIIITKRERRKEKRIQRNETGLSANY